MLHKHTVRGEIQFGSCFDLVNGLRVSSGIHYFLGPARRIYVLCRRFAV